MAQETITIEPRVILFSDIHEFSIVAVTLAERQFAFMQAIYERLGDVVVAHRAQRYAALFPSEMTNEPDDGGARPDRNYRHPGSRLGGG